MKIIQIQIQNQGEGIGEEEITKIRKIINSNYLFSIKLKVLKNLN